MRRLFLTLFLLALTAPVLAQTQPIPADRRTDWTYAGIPGGIPTYSQICANYTTTTFNITTINAKIEECGGLYPAGSVITLEAGDYTIPVPGIVLRTSRVVLRGAGADQTTLHLTADNYVSVLMGSGVNELVSYAAGNGAMEGRTFTVSAGDVSQFRVNDWITLRRDTIPAEHYLQATQLYVYQPNVITNITGTTITVRNPWYFDFTSGNPTVITRMRYYTKGIGLENLKIDNAPYVSLVQGTGVKVSMCDSCWFKGIEHNATVGPHILLESAINNEVRDSYIYGIAKEGTDAAGVYISTGGLEYANGSHNRIENNIIDRHQPAVYTNNTTGGHVIIYNYAPRSQGGMTSWGVYWSFNNTHEPHPTKNLYEGNIATMAGSDNYFGGNSYATYYRNFFTGANPGYEDFPESRTMIDICRLSYYNNVVGNILGTPASKTEKYNYTGETWTWAVYRLGYPNMGNDSYLQTANVNYPGLGCAGMMIVCPASPDQPPECPCNSTVPSIPTWPDPKVASTMMRWGNWDTYTHTVRWETSELGGVPQPPDHTLPASYVYTSKPSYFGSVAWPPIGPDVDATTVAGIGTIAIDESDHANKIPAQLCWESRNLKNGGTFNAAACYSGSVALPNAPTNVRIR